MCPIWITVESAYVSKAYSNTRKKENDNKNKEKDKTYIISCNSHDVNYS